MKALEERTRKKLRLAGAWGLIQMRPGRRPRRHRRPRRWRRPPGWRWRSSLPGPRTTRARASGMLLTTSSTASRARPLGSRSPPALTRRATPAARTTVATRPATRAHLNEPPGPRQS
ncbi:hypothetical protein [Oryza sativa Japonica Group]|uniref:Uncharacterized protein n=1 Tax=Oryza sativa subsp. japonica TaxID=39947 RepID=Q5ZDH5_ORYSJ|nr:hypothetical protein [Oryza sativa Japonica Group]